MLQYVVALVLVLLKWAHFSLNSKWLSRYDATKLAHPRAFSQIFMGKMVKWDPDFNLRRVFPAAW